MRVFIKVVWVLLMWSATLQIQADDIKFEHLNLEDGLSQATVYSILQDKVGTIWFGTGDGLNLYDGYTFTVYRNQPDVPHTLSNNSIPVLYEDNEGIIWVGTDGGGLNRFDRTTQRFEAYRADPNDPNSLSSNKIWAIAEDNQGVLWLGTEGGGLNLFNKASGEVKVYQHDPNDANSLSHNNVWAIYVAPNNVIWIGTEKGFNRFDPATETFTRYLPNPDVPYSLTHEKVRVIIPDQRGQRLWLGTEGGGLNLFNPLTKKFFQYKTPQSEVADNTVQDNLQDTSTTEVIEREDVIKALTLGQEGLLWVATYGNGLHKFNPEKRKFVAAYRPISENSESISNDKLWSVYKDRAGLLWIGTFGSGVNKYDPIADKFPRYQHQPNDPNSLSSNDVWAIYEDSQQTIWVGTYGDGLNKLKFHDNSVAITRYSNTLNPNELSDRIACIHEDSQGFLWIGTYGGGLNKLDKTTGEYLNYYVNDPDDTTSISHDKVWTVLEDSGGTLWAGTFGGGLNRYDPSTDSFRHYRHDPEHPNSLSDDYIAILYEGQNGDLWIGTFGGGLNRFDRDTGQFIHYRHDKNNPNTLSNDQVLSIYETVGGLWIGTYGGGVNYFDFASGKFTRFREKDGLANDSVYGILEDNLGKLWMSTNKGLSRYHPAQRTFKNYDVRDGLQSNEFNVGAYARAADGQLFFGGINGINAFYPHEIGNNPNPPPVIINDFQIYNKSVPIMPDDEDAILRQAISVTDHLTLSYKHSVFSFEFVALNYSLTDKNQYAYMLEGFDWEWNYIGTKRSTTYTNIYPGNYVFKVKASNNDNIWNDDGVAITITITPPWWQTWWAYTLYVIALLSLIIWFILSQQEKVKKKQQELEREQSINERLKQADKMKDEFLANTSHELRTPLNGIIGLTESLLDGIAGPLPAKAIADLSMVTSSGKRLSNLVDDILVFSKLKNQEITLEIKPTDIYSITDVILMLSQPLLANKKIDLHNQIPKELPMVSADENRLQQILHNLIGNAIKFTEAGAVSVNAQVQKDGYVAVSVHDTGIGIPEDKFENIFQSFNQGDSSTTRNYGGTGLGLSVTKQLVDLHGGKVWVASEVSKGSTFTFTLPISDVDSIDADTALQNKAQLEQIRRHVSPMPEHMEGRVESNLLLNDSGDAADTSTEHELSDEEKFHILIVDDEPVNLQVLENHLTLQNYLVTKAQSGMQALEMVAKHGRFDLIVLDVMMPKMSGYEVCERLRKYFMPNELPIILLTAKDQAADLVMGFELGANDYLVKPFSKSELLSRIKTQINLAKITQAYGRFVPHQFINFLEKDSVVDIKLGDQVQKEMTVLFSDIRGFTSLSERMSPQENFNFINGYLSRMEPIIGLYHGFIDKYIGDAIMALFPTCADDAVIGSINMLKNLHQYNEEREITGDAPIRIGIGLHTGTLMLGTVGGTNRMDGTVISDAVNLASRIEGMTKMYGAALLISDRTYDSLRDVSQYKIRIIDRVQAKGKSKAVTVYEVFDGDAPDVIEIKTRTFPAFQAGLDHYKEQTFTEAQKCFEAVLADNPEDKAAQIYVKRCTHFQQHGVKGDWTGVEALEEK